MAACKTKPKVKKGAKLALKGKISKESPNNEYVIGEIILGTVPGYPPWPATILGINEQTITVQFFGTGERYGQTN